MNRKCIDQLSLLLTAAVLAGCETTTPHAARIAQHAEMHAALPAADRREVEKGSIKKGYTPDMVFLALGTPDAIESSADGRSSVWTYHNFHPSAAVAPGNLYRTTIKDPLEEIRDAWVNNQSRYDQLTRPPDEQKRSDQSWSDYAKSNPADRALRNPLEQQVNRQREMPEPDSLPQVEAMRLDVVFENKVVSDAFINETIPAFTPNPEHSS